MNSFQFQYPITQTIDAEDYEQAVIKYLKLDREHNIERIGFIDHMNHYRNGLVKYFNEFGKNKIKVTFGNNGGAIGLYGVKPQQIPFKYYPTVTKDGIVPSLEINTRGFGPNNMLIPMIN